MRIASAEWIARYGLSSRAVCRKAQLEIAHQDERVFSIEGDLAMPSVPFHREIPERFLQAGIAEADLVGIAVGLSFRGKIPFANSFASFLTFRANEQVRLEVAYHKANVKLVGYYAGLSGGVAASTHHATEDLAALRAMPGLTIVAPADAVEAYKATWAAYLHHGPVYLRISRAETPQVYFENYDFVLGKAVRLREGSDLTLVATGNLMVAEAVKAADLLAKDGLRARVVNLHTIKPIDREEVAAAARETGALVTVEDHQIFAGMGCAVAEVVLQTAPAPVERVGIPDCFCHDVASHEEMLTQYRMDADAIVAAAHRALARKGVAVAA